MARVGIRRVISCQQEPCSSPCGGCGSNPSGPTLIGVAEQGSTAYYGSHLQPRAEVLEWRWLVSGTPLHGMREAVSPAAERCTSSCDLAHERGRVLEPMRVEQRPGTAGLVGGLRGALVIHDWRRGDGDGCDRTPTLYIVAIASIGVRSHRGVTTNPPLRRPAPACAFGPLDVT